MRILTGSLIFLAVLASAVFGGTLTQSYWSGSQEASVTSLEFDALRYRTMSGPYTADTLSLDPHNFDTARWDLDIGLQTNLGVAYAGYYELRHDSPSGIPNWRISGLEFGLRGSGEGDTSIIYDIAIKPGTWLGLDTTVGVQWIVSPTTRISVGFTDWRWTSPDGYLMNWSGPYLAVSF